MVEYWQKESYGIGDLLDIVRLLRSEGGCPWDIEQTHASIRNGFIEEVFEAVEAIDLEDTALLREELGDVLLQVVFHCQIETEQSGFNFADVCDEICKKLIVRHPHVFGNVIADSTSEVLKNWDSIKMDTKGQQSYADTLRDVAKSLPALMRAQKVGKRASRAGMDFASANAAIASIDAEKHEFDRAVASGNKSKIADELGDLLFSCVNAARHLDLDAEEILSKSTDKFIRRFAKTEELIASDNLESMNQLSSDELDFYWEKSKKIILEELQ